MLHTLTDLVRVVGYRFFGARGGVCRLLRYGCCCGSALVVSAAAAAAVALGGGSLWRNEQKKWDEQYGYSERCWRRRSEKNLIPIACVELVAKGCWQLPTEAG